MYRKIHSHIEAIKQEQQGYWNPILARAAQEFATLNLQLQYESGTDAARYKLSEVQITQSPPQTNNYTKISFLWTRYSGRFRPLLRGSLTTTMYQNSAHRLTPVRKREHRKSTTPKQPPKQPVAELSLSHALQHVKGYISQRESMTANRRDLLMCFKNTSFNPSLSAPSGSPNQRRNGTQTNEKLTLSTTPCTYSGGTSVVKRSSSKALPLMRKKWMHSRVDVMLSSTASIYPFLNLEPHRNIPRRIYRSKGRVPCTKPSIHTDIFAYYNCLFFLCMYCT